MKKIERKIIFYTEFLKILWITLIALTGTIATLFLNPDNVLKIILLVLSILAESFVIMLVREYNKEVLCLIESMEEE